MYMPWAPGLGAKDCPEPVSEEEFQRIRGELGKLVNAWRGQAQGGIHWHEGHPDIKAFLADIMPRMLGLYERQWLIRCFKEGRKKAEEWTATVDDLLRRVKSQPATYSGFTTVSEPFRISSYNVPTYTIRASTDPAVEEAMERTRTRVEQRPAGGPSDTPVPAEPEVTPAGLDDLWVDLTTGQVFGVEKRYITYALIGLVGYDIFRRVWK